MSADPIEEYVDITRRRIAELVGVTDQAQVDRLLAAYFLGARDAYQLAQDLTVEQRIDAQHHLAALYRRVAGGR